VGRTPPDDVELKQEMTQMKYVTKLMKRLGLAPKNSSAQPKTTTPAEPTVSPTEVGE
jgi:hypothetical protein